MEHELISKIDEKRQELNKLEEEYSDLKEEEKNKVMKTKGFDKVLYLLNQEFESSCSRTPQYLEFHKAFKREFSNLIKPFCEKIEISKPNHFDVSGFFQLKNGKIFYISIGDLRWSKSSMLIRTAKGFKDYTGGSNGFIRLDDNFVSNLLRIIGL